jgi:hypothetical protein
VNARVIPALLNSGKGTLRTFWRAARQLFHETVGAIFSLFAVYGALAAWRQWKIHSLWLMGFAIAYAVMMVTFAFVSFRRARQIR